MSTTIDELAIEITSNVKTANDGLSSLKKTLSSLERIAKTFPDMTSIGESVNAFGNALDGTTLEKLNNFSTFLNRLSSVKIRASIGDQLERIAAAAERLSRTDGFGAAIDKIKSISNLVPEVTAIRAAANNVRTLLKNVEIPVTQEVSQEATDFTKVVDTSGGVESVDNVTASVSRFQRAANVASSVVSSAFSIAKDNASSFLSMIQRGADLFTEKFGSPAYLALNLIKNGFRKLISPVTKASSAIQGFLNRLKGIVMYRAVRAALMQIKNGLIEGINNLYQWSSTVNGTFKGSMDDLSTSFLYLKNSVGAMVSPLIEAVAPAVDYVIDKFVSLLNVVNQFLSRVTGKTSWTKALRVAKTYSDGVSSSASNGADAVNELKNALLGIDELNILSRDTGSSGTGGSGSPSSSTDYGLMFEEATIDSGIGDFADQIRKSILNGDWHSVGSALGKKFNEAIAMVKESNIGTKLAKLVNNGISIAKGFFSTADFEEFGTSIGTQIEAILEDTDWQGLGEVFGSGLTSIVDFGTGLLNSTKASEAFNSVSGFFSGVFNSTRRWIAGKDWKTFGSTCFRNLSSFWDGIDTGTFIDSFYEWLGTVTGAIFSAIGGVFEDGWTQLSSFLKTGMTRGWSVAAEEVLDWDISGAATSAAQAFDNGLSEVLGQKFGFFGEESSMMDDLADSIDEGLDELFGGLITPHVEEETKSLALEIGSKEYQEQYKAATSKLAKSAWYGFSSTSQESGEDFFSEMRDFVKGKVASGESDLYDSAESLANSANSGFDSRANRSLYYQKGIRLVGGLTLGVNNQKKSASSTSSSLGETVANAFDLKANKSGFVSKGIYIVRGLIEGLSDNSWISKLRESVEGLGTKISEWFNQKVEIGSPSKLFEEKGGFIVEGLNIGISDAIESTKKTVDKWISAVTDSDVGTLQYAFAADMSNLDYYTSDAYARDVSAQVTSHSDVSSEGLESGLEAFYRRYMEPVMLRMASDMERQANKQESTVVTLDGRTLTKVVNKQTQANGYSFRRG